MHKRLIQLSGLTAAYLVVCSTALAQQPVFPSHCVAGETVFLSAKMKRATKNPQGGINFADTGKVVSLCADRAKDPIAKLSYRFGPIGKVEMEQVATPTNMFGTASRQTSPRTGEDIYFFSKGDYTYYVTVAGGMGSGIGLIVYQGNKKIVDLFSGTDSDTDFQMPWSVTAKATLSTRTLKHAVE